MKLSDVNDRKLAVLITADRSSDLITAATAVKTTADALIAGDTIGQFADEDALNTAVTALRDAYNALTVQSLTDASAYFTIPAAA